VHQFPNGSWVQGIETRTNGHLVISLYDRPEVYTLDPVATPPSPQLTHKFASGSQILCMTRYAPNSFAILVRPPDREGDDDSAQLWTITGAGRRGAQLVGDVAEAASFVSLTPLTDKILLASNSNGAIHRIDVTNGSETALFTDPTMTNGIGGIKYDAPEMYFVTPVNGMFARFQLDPNTGDAIAPVEVIVTSGLVGVQDFVLATWVDHTAFMVNYEQNSIQKIDENAKVSTVVAGWRAPTCITTGSTTRDNRTLYIGTGGTLGLPGLIVAIKV
jgi:hypothetical protein